MGKLIIDNRSTTTDENAIDLVKGVMRMGRISETAGRKHYCHAATFGTYPQRVVYASITRTGTDTFIVMDDTRAANDAEKKE